jgi:hypothetical protein
VLLLGTVPLTVAHAIRTQPNTIKDVCHLALDDEWARTTYSLIKLQLRWAALDRIVEAPEVWYLMFGKLHA